jgi:hypothetical protein
MAWSTAVPTAGDSFDDGQEFAAGTNPLKPELDVFLATIFLTTTVTGIRANEIPRNPLRRLASAVLLP